MEDLRVGVEEFSPEWREWALEQLFAEQGELVLRTKAALLQPAQIKDFVYFIACEQFVKIGYTYAPFTRLHLTQTLNPYPVVLLGVVVAPQSWEGHLHAVFAPLRERGEWFRNVSPLSDYIERLKKSGMPQRIGRRGPRYCHA